MKVFLDTSFFVGFFMGKREAKEVYESVVSEELYTSLNVIEETTYILMKLRASDLTGIKKHYDLMKEMKGNEKVYEKCFNLSRDFFFSLSALDIKVLPLTLSWEEVLETMKEFRLFPNDALIAATCRHHGITRIATFDDDFRRVDFLEVITPG
ncbi:MAG: PIN domain-containing protein [Candidatus Syntrophoarchaeum sp. WYZ-LMO15]|nr:MAG: PIN domain-containing protein [Candidatus Syntrophoarchaeum sp. WYZ-LMO15]